MLPYHFNGKETDGETAWQDYGMRIYNPALAKFLSTDPLTREYPELTPYQFASNTPIQAVDLDGAEALVSYITTNSDGTSQIRVMADPTVINNATVPMRNRVVLNGTEITTFNGTMGVPYLDARMQNVRMQDGKLTYDYTDASGSTATTQAVTGQVTSTDPTTGLPVTSFSVNMNFDMNTEDIGSIPMFLTLDGSSTPGVAPTPPLVIAVPPNADPGSATISVTLNDFEVQNISTIAVTNPGAPTVNTTLAGSAGAGPVNTTVNAAPGANVTITTPQAPPNDDFILSATLDYTITPR